MSGKDFKQQNPGKIKIFCSIENPKDPPYKADRRLLKWKVMFSRCEHIFHATKKQA